ncbi:MAG: DUF5681 domain-containing protein [Terricaulis sp.]
MADDEPGEGKNANRSKKTGRFLEKQSGNLGGRPPKPKGAALPFEIAQEFMAAANIKLDITTKGKREKISAREAASRQLALAAAKGDKTALRLFHAQLKESAATLAERNRIQTERLGAYLKARDEGRAWPLDESEAAFYQRKADEAGLPVTIKATGLEDKVEPLTEGDLELFFQEIKKKTSLFNVGDSQLKDVIRRAVYADRKLQLQRQRPKAASTPDPTRDAF